MPKFEPGHKKVGGREEGKPNKKTQVLLDLFEEFNFCPGENLIKLLRDPDIEEKLNPKEYADINLKLMEFKFPRRKAVEHTGNNGEDLFAKLLKKVDGSEK